jgi:acyl carrier protein
MTQLDSRLIRCFSSLFPTLTEDEVRLVDVAYIAELDSLAGVTLVALINDEFGVDIDLEGMLELGSFQGVRRYLVEKRPYEVSAQTEETE